MKTFAYLSILLFFSTIVVAHDLASVNIPKWTKVKLASDHLRFSSNEYAGTTLHLQIDSFDRQNAWTDKTIATDVKKMADQRKLMSSFMGLDNYKIIDFRLTGKKMPTLELTGSYTRLKKQRIKFKEINFYYQNHFLQLKIISENELPEKIEIENIIKEINPSQMDID